MEASLRKPVKPEERLTTDERVELNRKIRDHEKVLLAGIKYRALTMRRDLIRRIVAHKTEWPAGSGGEAAEKRRLRQTIPDLLAERKAGAVYALMKWSLEVRDRIGDPMTEDDARVILASVSTLEQLMPEIGMEELRQRRAENDA
jgi:hypothetical protein